MVEETSESREKPRKARKLTPPNILKEKVGSGGLPPEILVKAQRLMKENDTDYRPIAEELLQKLDAALENIQQGALQGAEAVKALLAPAMSFKAQGAMFNYDLVTEIADTLVNFLETVEGIDHNALRVVTAHRVAIAGVMRANLRGREAAFGKKLRTELQDTCDKYHRVTAAGTSRVDE